ncbi:Na+/H+ antiporter [Sphingomonas sp. BN140010]|uniref:Na+/H+ antiporter n=1 Tax=Sphingomonas arvum TaxID=2992113 RepID=A0ABT3JG59_9SPHN|nr:Na+/H+ antiporter [Sphingomonas sp. BN140010]MCW3798078.1 Na+/H+ antiporter [Sphingomonas sp. BN140010]
MHPVQTFELILVLLGAAVALHLIAARLGLPPSAALLVGGGALASLPGLPPVSLDPELILVLFLPPLLFDGAYYTAFGRFRRHLPGIMSLAVGAVLFTAAAVAIVTHWLIPGLSWAACFALGAVVSPPDAIAARAVLQRVTLPRRLQALLEGESLLNDATGLVLFRFAVAATLVGSFDANQAVGSFFLLALGGVAVGAIVSAAWMFVLRRLHDDTLVVAASTLMCWAAYLAGEALQVSGVIATVTSGIAFGWFQHGLLPARVRLQGSAFWRTLVFTLEALIFILMGFSLRGVVDRIGFEQVLGSLLGPALLVTGAVIVARLVWVMGTEALLTTVRAMGMRSARPLGWRSAAVLGWVGMRGVVTLAIALSLPAGFPQRDLMLVTAFAVILVTVVLQGATLGGVIALVRPKDIDPPAPVALPAAEAAVARVKFEAAEQVAYDGNGELIHPQLLETYRSRAVGTERYAADADRFMEKIRPHFSLMLGVIAAGRAELLRLHREGQIEDEVLHDLERDLDLEEVGIIYQRGDDAPG